MFGKSILSSIVLATMLLISKCGPTQTPSVTQNSILDLYGEPDKCSIAPPQPIGEITYESWMPGSFSGTLKVTGLEANHVYVFTINGKDGFSGNKELKSSCAASASNVEGYCDIDVRSTDKGTIDMTVTKDLDPGQYEPKFFIKDKSQNFCILLYNNEPPSFEIIE